MHTQLPPVNMALRCALGWKAGYEALDPPIPAAGDVKCVELAEDDVAGSEI